VLKGLGFPRVQTSTLLGIWPEMLCWCWDAESDGQISRLITQRAFALVGISQDVGRAAGGRRGGGGGGGVL